MASSTGVNPLSTNFIDIVDNDAGGRHWWGIVAGADRAPSPWRGPRRGGTAVEAVIDHRTTEQAALMLTKKAKYGLKAMLHLAEIDFGSSVFVASIAQANDIPKKFLDTILGELKGAGLLSSKKGRNGGYALAERPGDIKIGTIIRILDGALAPIPCASRTGYKPCSDCATVETCRIRTIMLDVREAIAGVLDHMTLAEARDNPLGPAG